MNKKRAYLLTYLITGLFFLLLDQWLKWQSLHNWNSPNLLNKFFGWQPFLNPGVAFGLPLPNLITITFSILVIILLIYLLINKFYILNSIFSILLIISGALSNLIDRLIYSHTVDYLLILTAVINLADILIVLGFLLLFLTNYKKTS